MVLRKPELAGKMVAWSVKLLEFYIQYKPHGPMKTQFMADFLTEFTRNNTTTSYLWILYVDNASNIKGNGIWIILEGPNNITLEQSLKLSFKSSNNQA